MEKPPNPERDAMESRILILAPTGRDAVLASQILSDMGMSCLACADEDDLCREIGAGAAVAILADQFVQKADTSYPEGAFAAGLLHDLGRLMVALTLPNEYGQIVSVRAESGRPLEDCEQEVLETTHSELSAAALHRWGLPSPIQKAVLYHHRSNVDPAASQSR